MRRTIAREEILRIIEDSATALSHAEIEEQLNGLCNRVTIYRVLDRLEEANLIHKFINVDGNLNYAACNHPQDQHNDNHVHFSCMVCGEATCLEHVVPHFKLPRGYVSVDANITVSGICPKCLKKKHLNK